MYVASVWNHGHVVMTEKFSTRHAALLWCMSREREGLGVTIIEFVK